MKKKLWLLASILAFVNVVLAQGGYNKLSVRPVHTSDVMYQKTVTRALDLREKQNEPLFSRNREITALLIDGVTNERIKAYENDSLRKQLSIADFSNKMLTPTAAAATSLDTVDSYLEHGPGWRDVVKNMLDERYMARDLYQLEIKENVLFDKQRSQFLYDIQTVTIFIPADHPMNERGIQIPVASFSYKEIVSALFKDNPKAIWYNTQNDQENKNLADAFDLRLFSSYIIKVSNAKDTYLTDIYSDQKTAIMASSWAAQQLMEYEHNLWEF
jgi:gliding motility associated protien GldN